MANLENLRKQAKQILRWHRDRHYTVAAEIRRVLPRFQGLSDREVLARPFHLADAQEMVARQAGFDSWAALKQGMQPMTKPQPTAAASSAVVTAEAQLFVGDMQRSLDFFTAKLGFATVFVYGEPSFYAQVSRGGAFLNLRCVDTPVIDPARVAKEDLLAASIVLQDAKPLFLEYQAAGVPFHQTLRTEPWGARTFIVKDPDGNLLLFAGPGGD